MRSVEYFTKFTNNFVLAGNFYSQGTQQIQQ